MKTFEPIFTCLRPLREAQEAEELRQKQIEDGFLAGPAETDL